MDKQERVAQIVQAEIFAFNDGGWGVDDDAAKAIAARILAALEPVTAQEPRQISDVPPDGTWAVLHPGHYGAFTACALNGGWSMCDDADLRFATHWVPCPFTARALAERGK